MKLSDIPPQRITEPPEDRWRKCPEHVQRDIKRFDRRLHVWWHAGEGSWQILEFRQNSHVWSHVSFWKQPLPTTLGILQALSNMDKINARLRHVQDLEAATERERERIKAATVSEREYLKRHVLGDWAAMIQGKFTTSFRADDKPRPRRALQLPTDVAL